MKRYLSGKNNEFYLMYDKIRVVKRNDLYVYHFLKDDNVILIWNRLKPLKLERSCEWDYSNHWKVKEC